jgi:hypothetical protein
VPMDCNLADMGTRPTVHLTEIGEQSDYQNGMDWIRGPAEEWLVKKTVTPPPAKQCRKDIGGGGGCSHPGSSNGRVAIVRVAEAAQDWSPCPHQASTPEKLTRVQVYVCDSWPA